MNSKEVSKSPISFPCDFELKIIGKRDGPFESEVRQQIQQLCPKTAENALSCKPSKNANYLAIRAKVHVESQDQLDGLYQALSKNPLVLFVL